MNNAEYLCAWDSASPVPLYGYRRLRSRQMGAVMKVFHTDKVNPDDLTAQEREWVYNGMDCCVTAEVCDVLLGQLDNHTAAAVQWLRQWVETSKYVSISQSASTL